MFLNSIGRVFQRMEALIAKVLAPFVTKCNLVFNLRFHVLFSIRLRRLNGLMWEDGRDRVDLFWEPKGKVLICSVMTDPQLLNIKTGIQVLFQDLF